MTKWRGFWLNYPFKLWVPFSVLSWSLFSAEKHLSLCEYSCFRCITPTCSSAFVFPSNIIVIPCFTNRLRTVKLSLTWIPTIPAFHVLLLWGTVLWIGCSSFFFFFPWECFPLMWISHPQRPGTNHTNEFTKATFCQWLESQTPTEKKNPAKFQK